MLTKTQKQTELTIPGRPEPVFEWLLGLCMGFQTGKGWDEHSRQRKHAPGARAGPGRAHAGPWCLMAKAQAVWERRLLIAGMKRKQWVWSAEDVMCWVAMLPHKGRGDKHRQDE